MSVTATPLSTSQQEYVDGLRAIADWLEQHPEYVFEWSRLTINLFVDGKDGLAEFARAAGRVRKEWLGDWFTLRATFGPHQIDANVPREQVCRKVVTGTREIPAREATTEEIVEWVCDDPVILAETTAA